ncbi:hypothetical protein [Hymenobacter tenuis]
MDTLAHVIARAKAALQAEQPRIVLTMAQTGLALAVDRLQRTGLPGRRYSTNPIPKYWLQPTNAAGRAYVKKEKKPTYAGIRGAQGMETGFVNLTYSGRMLRSLQPVPAGTQAFVSFARVVSSDRENARKLERNIAREGEFLAPTAREQDSINRYAGAECDRVIQQALQG